MESWELVKILTVSWEITLFLSSGCENGLKLKLHAQGLRSYLHVRSSKRYTIWGREFIFYFIISRPCHLILNTRLPNNTKVTDSTMEWLQPSLFVFIERQMPPRSVRYLMNKLPVIGSLCLRLDFWDRHWANIAELTGRNCMAKGCSNVQKKDFRERLSLFRRFFIRNGLG